MNKINMQELGLSERFLQESTLYENLYIGRVISQSKNLYKVITENGELAAEVSGKFRYEVQEVTDYPAVGDFVMLDRTEDSSGNGIIHHVLTRKSAFIRKAAGTSHTEQIVAANIDTVFICMSLNNDFNIRRLERYISIAWDSGATPVIVLTKADLCHDLTDKLLEVETVAIGIDIVVISSISDDGYLALTDFFAPGTTSVFIGSSGVGKSTLINRIMGEEVLETDGLRNDDKGRHTTTRREMFIIPTGGVVIDTPGMRELGLESADISRTFTDIDELATQCKFRDCTHTREPKCAVQKAIQSGDLSQERFDSYLKLKKEAKYEGLNSKQIENEKLNEMFKVYGGMKNARKMLKEKIQTKKKY